MKDSDSKQIIPEDWISRIDQSEYEDVVQQVNAELLDLAGLRLNLGDLNEELVLEECAKSWNTTAGEVKKSWQAIVNRRAIIRLFTRYYGHLFPCDAEGESILDSEDMAWIYGDD